MKKVFIFIAFAAAGILATSCAKQCGINQQWNNYTQQCENVPYGNNDPNNNFGGNSAGGNAWNYWEWNKVYTFYAYKSYSSYLGTTTTGKTMKQFVVCTPYGEVAVIITAGQAMAYDVAASSGCRMAVKVTPMSEMPAMVDTETTIPAGTPVFTYISSVQNLNIVGTPWCN